ncbi:MAG TPA: globin domain-containing protein, partial [Thermoanaerobaculia bacterium]|nr:globin domain-containing protein [Thermoanaerobaculia bacterium]
TISPTLTLGAMMRDLRSDTIVSHRDQLPISRSSVSASRSDVTPATPDVTFVGELGGEIVVDAGVRTILEASLNAGIPHTHECGGNARCSTCRVVVLDGGENLSPRDSAELKLAQRFGFADDVRLACQTRVRGPVRVRRLIIDDSDVQLMRGAEKPSLGAETPLAILSVHAREIPALLRRSMPYDTVHILNRYYLQVGETVLANGGVLEPPSGSTLFAFFGLAGDDSRTKCTNAIRAALRLRARLEPLNSYLVEHFATTLTVDIGLHYGRMIVGSIGHPQHMRLTALGEPANVAASVAALNERFEGSGIMATEELINVVDLAVTHGHVSHERIGEREFTVYEILDFAKPDTHYLVQSSFELVAVRREEASRLFYEHLFRIAPQTRSMFAGVDMAVQGTMLMNMIAAAVKGLDRLDELKPVLVDLARRHATYGVQIEHYAAVEACLLYTLEQVIGPSFNLDVKLAWTAIYNFIAETMIEAQLSVS